MPDDFWEVYKAWRSGLESRMRDEISRRQRVSPYVDVRAAVNFVMDQEREEWLKRERQAEESEFYGLADFVDNLVHELLPEVGKGFLDRNR